MNFNPRSHERSDVCSLVIRVLNIHFNPRSHERSDDNSEVQNAQGEISIHAPTRGATFMKMIYYFI